MKKTWKLTAVILFSVLFLAACGKNKQQEESRIKVMETCQMQDVILEKESLLETVSGSSAEKQDENYKKMKRIGEKYYLLSESGQTGKLLVLNQELSITGQVIFEIGQGVQLEDFCVTEEGKKFHVVSVQEKEDSFEKVLFYDEYDWEGKCRQHVEAAQVPSGTDCIAVKDGCFLYCYDTRMFTLYDQKGNKVWEKAAGSMQSDGIMEGEDGCFYVLSYGDRGTLRELIRMNPANGKIEASYETEMAFSGIPDMSWGETGDDIFFCDGKSGIYRYHLSEETSEKLADWLNSGIDGKDCMSVCAWGDRLLCLSGNGSGKEGQRTLKKLVPGKKKEKEVLTFGIYGVRDQMLEAVSAFNQKNETVQLQIRDYSEAEDAKLQLQLDIAKGECPDILDISIMNGNDLIKKGILTDLYPLMEEDPQMQPEMFLETVRNLMEYDGKLYVLPEYVCLQALVLDKTLLEEKEISETVSMQQGLSLSAIEKLWEKHPQKMIFLNQTYQTGFLWQILRAGRVERFFAAAEKEDEFSRLLAFSKKLPSMENRISVHGTEEQYQEIKKGNVLFYPVMMSDPLSTIKECRYLYGEDQYVFTGYPGTEGSGVYLSVDGSGIPCFGISVSCPDKEAAWQFVRSFLTEEAQEDTFGIPVRKEAFEKMLDRTAIFPGISGKKETSLTEKEKEQVRQLVNSAEYLHLPEHIQAELQQIVLEDAMGYFAGEKTLEETVEVIKSRVNLLVHEQE